MSWMYLPTTAICTLREGLIIRWSIFSQSVNGLAGASRPR